jgi:hypothetical protein
MLYTAHLPLLQADRFLRAPETRHRLIARLFDALARRNVLPLAFCLTDDGLRLAAWGDGGDVTRAVAALKSGTARAAVAARQPILWDDTDLDRWDGDPNEAIAWVHAPLSDVPSSPFTSARDWAGLRRSPWIDVQAAARAVPGLTPPPPPPPHPNGLTAPAALDAQTGLHVAADTLGRRMFDPPTVHLFAHLMRSHGSAVRHIADTVGLTDRRIRQILAAPEPELPRAQHLLQLAYAA